MNSFGDKIVFAQIKKGRDQLIALNVALRQAFEAVGLDCKDRYTPHITVMKVRRWKPVRWKYLFFPDWWKGQRRNP